MKLTAENYYSQEANHEYMSVSQYKAFVDCEARAMAELRGEYHRPDTTALLVGSYVDAYFEETLDTFKSKHPYIAPKDAPDGHINVFTAKGELASDFKQAEKIIERIRRDRLFMEYMSGKKQVIFTGELFGTKWKIKVDSLHEDKIVDLKIMRSMDRIMGQSFVNYWQYDVQMAIYAEIERRWRENQEQNIRFERKPTYLAVATKESITNLEIIHIPDWRHEECLADVEGNMPHILEVKNGGVKPVGCGICEYCRQIKVLKKPIDFELVGFSNKELNVILRGEI